MFEVIADLGSRKNYHKKGLKRLLDVIINRQVGRLVIPHKDQLKDFGAELEFVICEAKGVEVVILTQDEETTFEEDLAKVVLESIFVFSARLKYSRSGKTQKLLTGVEKNHGGILAMIVVHKIALDPNHKQATYFAKTARTAWFAYNWSLAQWQRPYKAMGCRRLSTQALAVLFAPSVQRHERQAFPVDAQRQQERATDGHHPAGRGLQELLGGACQVSKVQRERRA